VKIKHLHDWNIGIQQARQIQSELARQLIIRGKPDRLVRVAGADVSYSRSDGRLWACVVVLDITTWEVVEEQWSESHISMPYIPGYLSFREMPALLAAFEKVASSPDAVILDGQGTAHPRRMGIGAHVGLFLDVPTVGCAKSRLVGDFEPVGTARGSRSELRLRGTIIGWVLRTREGVKPVFVSPGHRIGLDEAADVVLRSCRSYRLPEPVRKAHQLSQRLRVRGAQTPSSRDARSNGRGRNTYDDKILFLPDVGGHRRDILPANSERGR